MSVAIIGQEMLKTALRVLIEGNNLPRLLILVGVRGSGKGQMCQWIGEQMGIDVIEHESKAEAVRDVVERSYKTSARILHVFRDIEDMSNASKNALLKVIEEPPNGAYFIMTSKDISNQALATIRSRGTVFYMDAYTYPQLSQYAKEHYPQTYTDLGKVVGLCETPYEVDLLMKYGVDEFFEFVDKVIDNIAVVSGSNSFKIGNKISFKADEKEQKYDLALFLKMFMKKCSDEMYTDPLRFAEGVKITSKYLQELSVASVNKQYVFDSWLLDIRKAWM